jgi:hypothetical protein
MQVQGQGRGGVDSGSGATEAIKHWKEAVQLNPNNAPLQVQSNACIRHRR